MDLRFPHERECMQVETSQSWLVIRVGGKIEGGHNPVLLLFHVLTS
jgi:hypothetical protein